MTFCSTFKVHNAANTNQKDKYETDLKKEIKKLQVCISHVSQCSNGLKCMQTTIMWRSCSTIHP